MSLCLAGCAGVDPTVLTSAWGDVVTLGHAPQADAPALLQHGEALWAAWIGADAVGVHHDVRVRFGGAWSEPVTLPLPPVDPHGQALFPAETGMAHLLWLDADGNGQTQLYSALLQAQADAQPPVVVVRGSITLTTDGARRFSAHANGDGTLWVAVSGGVAYAPNVYLYFIDRDGRPRLQSDARRISEADWPAFAQDTDGDVRLYWLSSTTGAVQQSAFHPADGALDAPSAVASSPSLGLSDSLLRFDALQSDGESLLIWNILRGAEQPEAWLATDAGGRWSTARRMTLNDGQTPLAWLAPIVTATGDVAAAVSINGAVSVAELGAGGLVTGYIPVVKTPLVGWPALQGEAGAWVLAWAQAESSTSAALQVVTQP